LIALVARFCIRFNLRCDRITLSTGLARSHRRRKLLAQPPVEKERPETAAEKRERIFKEGADALSDYEVAAVNIRKNMARLRELRLAKEAVDRAATAIKGTTKEVAAKRTKKRKPRRV
jgi:hypothetical protein